jgi:ribosome-binding protein aMBF1 (putative translation factor)
VTMKTCWFCGATDTGHTTLTDDTEVTICFECYKANSDESLLKILAERREVAHDKD